MDYVNLRITRSIRLPDLVVTLREGGYVLGTDPRGYPLVTALPIHRSTPTMPTQHTLLARFQTLRGLLKEGLALADLGQWGACATNLEVATKLAQSLERDMADRPVEAEDQQSLDLAG